MNEVIKGHARNAEAAAHAVQLSEELDAATVEGLGRAIRRSGTKIRELAPTWQTSEPPVDPGDPGDPGDPPVDPGEPGEPPTGGVDPDEAYWLTKIPDGLPEGCFEGKVQKTLSTGFNASKPVPMEGAALSGVWTRFLGTASWGESGTLWHYQGYNAFGTIDGLELWGIGDFVERREGHGLYVRSVPHLDVTISNYRARKLGGQAIQREWRRSETSIPETVWGKAGGTFTVKDCDLRETALIDERSGGKSVRGSWALSLYNTGQHTIVRQVVHHNFYSPAPHEGSLLVAFGTDGWRTPTLLVQDNDFYCRSGVWGPTPQEQDRRPIVFLEGVDDGLLERTRLRGEDAYVDLVDSCARLTVRDMPQATQVRVKAAKGPHSTPLSTYTVPQGAKATFTRLATGGMAAKLG